MYVAIVFTLLSLSMGIFTSLLSSESIPGYEIPSQII